MHTHTILHSYVEFKFKTSSNWIPSNEIHMNRLWLWGFSSLAFVKAECQNRTEVCWCAICCICTQYKLNLNRCGCLSSYLWFQWYGVHSNSNKKCYRSPTAPRNNSNSKKLLCFRHQTTSLVFADCYSNRTPVKETIVRVRDIVHPVHDVLWCNVSSSFVYIGMNCGSLPVVLMSEAKQQKTKIILCA